MSFLLGSDPELMLVDKASGELRSAIPFIDGKKDKPMMIPNGQVIHDNVNLEFGIEPAATEDEWVDRTGSVIRHISGLLPDSLEMRVLASANFPESELQHPEAKEFACDPDFDPYDFVINFIEDGAAEGTLRSCGGHVHIGDSFIADSIDRQSEAAKVMDVFLGIPSLLLDKDPSSHRRRELYGKAGAHRPKDYGVEYRAIGNFWISSPDMTRLVYRLVRDGLAAWKAGHLDGIKWEMVQATINDNNTSKAEGALKGFISPLLEQDTRDLLATCLEMGQTNLYEAWGI
jgi:phiEco32-like amidoligase-type 2 protein